MVFLPFFLFPLLEKHIMLKTLEETQHPVACNVHKLCGPVCATCRRPLSFTHAHICKPDKYSDPRPYGQTEVPPLPPTIPTKGPHRHDLFDVDLYIPRGLIIYPPSSIVRPTPSR